MDDFCYDLINKHVSFIDFLLLMFSITFCRNKYPSSLRSFIRNLHEVNLCTEFTPQVLGTIILSMTTVLKVSHKRAVAESDLQTVVF